MRLTVRVLGHPWFGAVRDGVFVLLATFAVFTVAPGYPGLEPLILGMVNAALVVGWGIAADVYDVSHPRVARPPLARLVRGFVWVLMSYLVLHFVTIGQPERRTVVYAIGAAAGALVVAYVLRALALVWFQRRGWLRERLLVVGGGEQAQTVAAQIGNERRLAMTLVGALDEFAPRSSQVGPVQVLGDPLDLEAVVDRTGATAVVVIASAISWEAHQHVMQVAADRPRLRIFMVAGVSDLLSSEVLPARDGMPPLVRLRPAHLPLLDAIAKRMMDVVIATLMLPVLAVVLLLARLSGGSPVTQPTTVLGRGGRPVTLRLIAPGPPGTLRAALAAGRANRLPALGAVLRGDLSIVGPRPLPPDALAGASADPWRRRLLLMRPGLTGPGAGDGASDLIEDLTYIRTYTIWSDVRLISSSVARALRRQAGVPAVRELAPDTPDGEAARAASMAKSGGHS